MRSFIMLFVFATFCLLAGNATAVNFVTVNSNRIPTPDEFPPHAERRAAISHEEGGGSYSCTKTCSPGAGARQLQ